MTEKDIDAFVKVQSQLEGLHEEISSLSKKSQNDSLNKFKLKFVNAVLVESNKILGQAYRPFNDFEQFDDEDLPSNSDVAMMLKQYLNCFEKLRADNIGQDSLGRWNWILKGQVSTIKTTRPERTKEK